MSRSDDYREGFFAGYRAGFQNGSEVTLLRAQGRLKFSPPLLDPEEAGAALVDALIAERAVERARFLRGDDIVERHAQVCGGDEKSANTFRIEHKEPFQ